MKPHAGLLKQPSCALALSFGAGLSPWAPGTIGALVAFPLCAVLRLAPPLVIDAVDIDRGMAMLDACIAEASR